MPGRHPPSPSPPPTPAPRSALDRRTLLLAAGAGALTTACATASGEPPGTAGIFIDNAAWAKPLTAAGRRMRRVSRVDLVTDVNPSLDSFEQVVKSSLRTSKTPDLLKYWSGYRLQDLARTGGIVDLTDHWDHAAGQGWVPRSLRSTFTYHDRVYALPMNLAYWVFFYNPKVFAAHHLTAPETWQDFLTVCARLKAGGITPLHATVSGRWPAFIWFMEVLTRQDPAFYDALMNGRARYTDPPAERALRTVASFADRDWFTALDLSQDDAAAQVVHGKLGMVPCGTFITPSFVAAGGRPGDNVDAFVLPMANPRARPSMVFESSAMVCTTKGPDRPEADRAAAGWLHPSVMAAFSHTLQDGCPNPLVTPANRMLAGIARTVREKKLWLHNRYWELSPPELVEAAVDDLAGFLLDPSSYRKVLRTMQGRADEAWKVWREADQV